MLKVDIYNFEGRKKEVITLPKEYDVKPNFKLLSQAVHVYEDRAHHGLARSKTRSEVSISTRKIYRQKGTGGARHGAKSAPIFVGGGTAHGPTGIKRVLRLSRSQGKKALLYALKYKMTDSRAVLVEGLGNIKKTKEAANLVKNTVKDRDWKIGSNIMLAFSRKNSAVLGPFKNIPGVTTEYFKNLNAYKVFLANGLIIDKEAIGEKTEKEAELKPVIGKRIVKSSAETTKSVIKTGLVDKKSKAGRVIKPVGTSKSKAKSKTR